MVLLQEDRGFDLVGKYDQDAINGFDSQLINQIFRLLEPEKAQTVLDAMAGDGNLAHGLYQYCLTHKIDCPKLVVLEYSQVQTKFASNKLAQANAEVIWGDILTMTSRDSHIRIPDNSFDRVMIKSSNHEIPRSYQLELYRSIYRVLKPGGLFVNLGMLFDDPQERDELREIARVKDTYAGMDDLAKNRHFLTREELYGWLTTSGFINVKCEQSFNYRINSSIVAQQYFSEEQRLQADLEHQAAQVRAYRMRLNGRIQFDRNVSLMLCPGEITTARKPLV
ncbi:MULTISPECIES: class I SAM-dependent methyltransferase [Nostocales]|uniref:class I SAM-dependent methyltransferase n=1 Tax=Nostocales TaxID=1161 RepID=UPI0016874E3B|nr:MULTISPECIES: class I SAM-dependent methyltransferase [Nostocales]MBD2300151.1 methyltransferase domain-containing protein [Nostoc sp. FACHB-190]MBD2487674.1 methyltransferase domain-containing protein [Aulosira sp. FACHB-615]